MALQKPERHGSLRESQKQLQRKLYISVVAITLSFFAMSASMGVVATLTITHSNWPIILGIVFAVLGIISAFTQWLFPYLLNRDQSAQTSSVSQLMVAPTLSNTTPLSSEQPALEHLSSSQESAYHHIVGLPPPTFSGTIQQRKRTVEEIYNFLIQPSLTAIALTGMGGVGKSTLAALVYRYAEDQRYSGVGPFKDEAIWLTINDNVTMVDLAGTLFEAMDVSLPDLSALSSHQLAVALFTALNTVDKPRLVILDQFENMLDKQSGHASVETERPGVGEWLDALNSQPCRCRVLLTSRILPQGTREYPPSHMQEYCVKGLDNAEGVELLRKQGVELAQATDAELSYAVILSQGHALALILLASLLRRNRSLTLSTFFQDPAYLQLWNGDIARNLLDYIFKEQLDVVQSDLLLAFSIYREPVPLEAAEMLIEGIPRAEIVFALNALIAQHLMQAVGEGRYQLHSIVANYARSQFQMEHKGNRNKNLLDIQAAHTRAVEYYLEQAKKSPPREMRRSSNDVRPFIEAIWHQCHAGKWREAYSLMERESIFPDLKRWGGNAILLELYQLLLPLAEQYPESEEAVSLYIYLGRVYRTLGRRDRAKGYFEKAFSICEKQHYHKDEGTAHSFLGSVYADLGQKVEAQEHLEKAIEIRKEVGDRLGVSWTLANLGRIYHELGQEHRARQICEQALEATRDVKNRRGEERTLNTLGQIYNNFGEKGQALKYYEEALKISREVGDRLGEGLTLNGLGLVYLALERCTQVLSYVTELTTRNGARSIFR
jgi:tetratricopeptide (TPR) repeat protein